MRVWDIHVHFPRGGPDGRRRPGSSEPARPERTPQEAVDYLAEKLRDVGTVKAGLLCPGGRRGVQGPGPALTYEACVEMAMKHEDLFLLHAVVDPAEQGYDEIHRLYRLGFRALKIIGTRHPYDWKDYFPAYRAAEELDMPILFHCGVTGGGLDLLKRHPRTDPESAQRWREADRPPEPAAEDAPESPEAAWRRMGPRETSATYMRPFHLETLANRFPRLKIIGAHYGGTGNYDEAASVARWRRWVYFDMSGGRTLERHAMERGLIGNEIPIEKLIFGSDCTADDIKDHVDRHIAMFETLGLSEEEKDLLWYRNAAEMFGVEKPTWAEE